MTTQSSSRSCSTHEWACPMTFPLRLSGVIRMSPVCIAGSAHPVGQNHAYQNGDVRHLVLGQTRELPATLDSVLVKLLLRNRHEQRHRVQGVSIPTRCLVPQLLRLGLDISKG